MIYDNLDISLSITLPRESRIDIPDIKNPPAGIPSAALKLAPALPTLCAFPIPEGIPLPQPSSFGFGEPTEGPKLPVVSVKPENGIRRYIYPASFPAYPLQSCDAAFIDSRQIEGREDQVVWQSRHGRIETGLSKEPDFMVHGFYRYEWADSVIPAKFKPHKGAAGKIVLDHVPQYGMIETNRCRLVNVFHALVENHYYLDRANRLIFFAAPPEGDVSIATEYAGPRFDLDSQDDVTFRNCVFHDIRGTAIRARNCRNLAFVDCVFECIGGHVMDILDCPNFRMERCRLRDTSAGALYIDCGNRRTLESGNAIVRDCGFERMGRLSSTYVPAIQLDGVGNAIEHCEFFDMPTSGVRFQGNNHLISGNYFHKLVLVSDDQGGVETFGDPSARGTRIVGNVFDGIGDNGDVLKCGRAAIRFDDMICENIVEDNIIIRSSWKGFGAVQSHGGGRNIIRHNLLRDCSKPLSITPWTHERWVDELASERVQHLIHEVADIDSPAYRAAWPSLATLADGPGENIVEDNTVLPD